MAATFSKSAAAVYAQRSEFTGVSFDHVRVILRSAAGDAVVKDTTLEFSPSSPDVTLEFTIDGAQPGDKFPVELQFLSGGTPIYKGTGSAQAYSAQGTAPTPTPVVVVYVGPGASATRITVAPKTISLVSPSTATFSVSAFDANGAPVTNVPLNWKTSDPSIATITLGGVLTTTGKRGTVTVTATTVTSLTDQGTVNVTLPPSAMVLFSGGGQIGKVGTTLGQPAVVRVTASDGVGVAGVNVNFAPPAGGKVGSTSIATDASGAAATSMTLGTTVGTQGFAATTAGLSVGISATATVGDPTAVVAVSGGGQTDTVKHALKNPFVVRVTDQFGNPVGGVTVTWSRIAGSGSLSGASSTSAADGSASIGYTLGTVVGTETISASILGGASTTFTAQAISAGASTLTTVSGSGQTGRVTQALAAPFVVKVTDDVGNPVAGATVTWAATNGTIAATTTTDATGQSSNTLTLGSVAGAAGATASVGTGPAAKSVSFSATAVAGIVAKLQFGGLPTGGTAGAILAPALTVELRDALGNLTAATNSVTIAIGTNPGGGTLGGTVTKAAVAGVATFSDLTLSAAGVGYTLVASSSGVPSVTTPAFTVATAGGGGPTTKTWTGAVSTDWSLAGNWSGGVPTATD
ncbi:MAG: Ig-like domain-containing protein, partial [Gemmatimonadaceae bacterium]